MARKKKSKTPLFDSLRPAEKQELLLELLAAHPELGLELEALAEEKLKAVSIEAVADDVASAIEFCAVDEIHNGSGSTEFGYIEPYDLARELLDEAVKPFFDELAKRFKVGREDEAARICQGIILGLYRIRKTDGTVDTVLGWDEDFPLDAALEALKRYQHRGEIAHRGKKNKAPGPLPDEFWIQVPEWGPKFNRSGR